MRITCASSASSAFFARFGRLPPDQEALAACAAAAETIGRLSGERIQTEMLKQLAAPAPLASLRLMAEGGCRGDGVQRPGGAGAAL